MKTPEFTGELGFEIRDSWFRRCHLGNLSACFCRWWVGHYGRPADYPEPGGGDEYYTRMAFALMGWRAAQALEAETQAKRERGEPA